MEVKESKKGNKLGSVDTLRNALELQSILAKRSKRASKSVPDNGDDDDLTKDSDVPKPHLCIGDTRYFGSDPNDFGWGCGYRNCQMILSSLQAIGHPLFSKHGSIFDNDSGKSLENVPSINGLQQILEKAWKEGFDAPGAIHFGHRIVGSKEWIGTTEIYCILSYLGLKCHIVDFWKPTGPNGEHPGIFEWIKSYFCSNQGHKSNSGMPETQIIPLYLQHQGHSRTIVGISQEENLLVFDPNLSLPLDEIGIIKEKYGTEKTNIRQKQIERDLVRLERLVRARNMLSPRDISSHQQYQILWVYTDGVVSEEDKNIVSSRVP